MGEQWLQAFDGKAGKLQACNKLYTCTGPGMFELK